MTELRVLGVPGLPEVRPGADLAALIVAALTQDSQSLEVGDVVVVTSKIVSKSEGRLVSLDAVPPSEFARAWAEQHGKDPRHVEVVLRETRRIVRMDHGVLIAETHNGFICANAGVDASNASEADQLVLLPLEPDASARGLREALRRRLGLDVAVVISDTFGRPWRLGQTNVAIGAAGIAPLRSHVGEIDSQGHTLRATALAVVDELAAAAELVMGKLDRVPVAIVRGYPYEAIADVEPDPGAGLLVRQAATDMFR